jgi:hypothetical protein
VAAVAEPVREETRASGSSTGSGGKKARAAGHGRKGSAGRAPRTVARAASSGGGARTASAAKPAAKHDPVIDDLLRRMR